ncbi:Biopolymer transport protein ExbD/TolR [Jannaschia seosinensis]|uniref:Biopolymer transport protein ExbD/TolR n=1 Tax=Jannaschia seosinensis TaxID=313367 RepID=A0A0M7BBU2_9RHOB|nr:biopolymer transporter ExbD [Jannaschia seosinensis]CUH39284.1 Biopolymer transport protein ExbD/TolR [Jannaschia seosinensis]
MRRRRSTDREPTIPLINVVFLMLVFFMVAGSIAPPLDRALTLVRTDALEGRAPPDALVIRADGTLRYRGETVDSASAFAADLSGEARAQIRVVPDRDLPAETLVAVATELRAAGAEKVLVVTERGLE